MNIPKSIQICEVGMRDGLQNEPKILTVDEKVSLINQMMDAGVKVIEVGSFMNPKAVPQLAETDEVFKRLQKPDDVEFRALIANLKGVERAVACGCKKVKLNVSASTQHNLANLNRTPKQSVDGFAECVNLAKESNIEISGSISMPFGSPWEREIPLSDVRTIIEAYLSLGINEISLSDASGVAYPTQVYQMFTDLQKNYPEVTWWLHLHNTRGMAIANVVAGLQAGITRFDASLAGLGGCPFIPDAAGNLSTEDLLHLCEVMGVETGIDIVKMIAMGNGLVSRLSRGNDSYVAKAGRNSDLIESK